jgi:diguanylate cyclase (GGDEF)-like protein
MNFSFFPDLLALTILIVILLLQRRRHRQEQADLWLLGLLITLVESIAHSFYAPVGIPTAILHVVVVDCYLLAGLVFVWASASPPIFRHNRFFYLSLNGVSLLALNTTYGLNIRVPGAYVPTVVAGILIGVSTAIILRRSWWIAGAQLCGWLAIAYLVRHHEFREAVYWSLSCLYAIAAFNFQYRLPSRSTGRLAILTGFSIWALCFFVHPWIVRYTAYADVASHIWNMQKSLISIGMILVMLEEQITNNSWLALHDELTGLPNRRLFADRLNTALDGALRTDSKLALIMLDLNGFKKINDTLGHHAGDHVLRDVAHRLRDNLRTSDTLARLGGDEFIIVATDLFEDRAADKVVETILEAMEEPLDIDGERLAVSLSLGVAVYPDDADDAIKLLRIADQRMYATKRKAVVAHSIAQTLAPTAFL